MTPYTYIKVGESAFVFPLNHPDTYNVPNGYHANTTTVVKYDETTGVFETKNTVYSPEKTDIVSELVQAAAQVAVGAGIANIVDDNGPSELDIDPDTHPSYTPVESGNGGDFGGGGADGSF